MLDHGLTFSVRVCYIGRWSKRKIIYVVLTSCLMLSILRDNGFKYHTVPPAKDIGVPHDGSGIVFKPAQNNATKELYKVEDLSGNSHKDADILDRYPTEGYNRANFLKKACESMNTRQSGYKSRTAVRVSYVSKHKTLFCPLCKHASTFWTRVFKMVEWNSIGKITEHPFQVQISNAPRSELYFDIPTQKISRTHDARDSFRFLFVRNPYSLLFSAFVDKIVGPNPYYWGVFGKPVISNANRTHSCVDITFEQFLRQIIEMYKWKRSLNCHVAKYDACQPCKMNYTFVAKMETFKEDTFHILSKLNQTKALKVFEDNFLVLHSDDAIEDSTSGPYSSKKQIVDCMPWHKALHRIWRKLQIRGVIGMAAFPLSDEEAKNITNADFIAILKQTRLKSTNEERSWQKKQAFKEAYQNVPKDILREIREIYADEFNLFNYDDLADENREKNKSFHRYGFMDYNNIKETFSYPNKLMKKHV